MLTAWVTEWPELLENVWQSTSLYKGKKQRIHYISIPVILFGPVSHIIHLWKIGKEWSMKGPWVRWKLTRQLERTEKRPEDSYWWISVKTDAKGYEFDNRAKHRGTAVNDLGSGAEQKWLVSRGCKDSKDLPRSTHRNRLCHPFELTVLSGVKSQLQQRCALATNTTIKSNKNDQRLNHRTNKTKRIRVIYTCKEESERTQESLKGFCKDKKICFPCPLVDWRHSNTCNEFAVLTQTGTTLLWDRMD